ncbi:GNAT family N-acetyltransferase [Pseudoalteromonas rubra]|uniref:N-acetyltransferase domain-containing protein n=1 Tax=Pseudoalteromonas rubra TaxID=43658 RepID=A0A5S3X5U9_9GAMM|nr:GNAT family N-acetyltransferase [Pseudoalteromonas rubra]TMP38982.1 hypothetical protein CWB98_04665 [Pseudoalteromonas rubra]
MSSDFIIQSIDKNSVQQAAHLIVNVFNEREPLAHLNAADPREFADYMLFLSKKCAEEGLGFIARETNTDRVIGAILSADLAETVNGDSGLNEVHTNPIAALIGALNGAYFTQGDIQTGTYLNIKFVATDANFKVKGMVTALISKCIQEAKAQGFKFAQAEATGNISQHIFANKLGFEEKEFIKYSEFEFAGDTPFSSITEHQGIKLLVKNI